MDKKRKPVPIQGLFHTPKDMDEVTAWIDNLPIDCRISAIIASAMTWNCLATSVNKEFELEEPEDAPDHSISE